MKESKIYAVVVEPRKQPEPCEIDNTLESFQQLVGGYIEVVGLEPGIVLICNEEGKIIGLPANRLFRNDIIMGTFLIVAIDDEGDFTSLPIDMQFKYICGFST